MNRSSKETDVWCSLKMTYIRENEYVENVRESTGFGFPSTGAKISFLSWNVEKSSSNGDFIVSVAVGTGVAFKR